MDKLLFLKEYRDNVELISIDDLNCFITDEWRSVFTESAPYNRIQNTINIWIRYCGEELRNTIRYLSEHLIDVTLIKSSYGISVIYELTMMDGSIDYYEGLLSTNNYDEEFLFWDKIPESLRKFYNFVHNGFYYYCSRNMGILPIQEVSCMNDYDWGIIEDFNLEIMFSLKSTYIFFETGMGGYVLLDMQNRGAEISIVWFSRKKPMYNKNFWDIVDEWIVMGFN